MAKENIKKLADGIMCLTFLTGFLAVLGINLGIEQRSRTRTMRNWAAGLGMFF
jgi:hypothetical protein